MSGDYRLCPEEPVRVPRQRDVRPKARVGRRLAGGLAVCFSGSFEGLDTGDLPVCFKSRLMSRLISWRLSCAGVISGKVSGKRK